MAGRTTNKIAWFVFTFLAIGVGLYPLGYIFGGKEMGLLLSKSKELLSDDLWNIGFYGHIIFGGIALLTGWSQFSKKLRTKHLYLHRNLGKIYVAAVLISGVCAVYIGFYATGGWVTSLGFILLGLVWLYTTIAAYRAIKKKDLQLHQGMMIYSYAACFAAVTLRLWLPLLTFAFGEFLIAYKIVAWLCWVPNLIFAHLWVRRKGLILG
ncbi:DUF2306 domain-containing protein [Allomuricauda sp. SCSIO 65647]|uniref:DUF2306 domain-containing protein n=1 Tax=Allomuricauda sp. SCSIO 65647 TaxID=2908843 RepID=UPI001F39844B|nr:DUF2306 domain-containing protein [Muricauda sp. SCSIO 65647]UJH66623.1 DUF2306 domain-containing protein [Muricauda sp. SCSIO 65647]